MTDLQKWEQQLRQELAEIRRSADKLATSAARVVGRGAVRGITVEVNAQGDITDLQIAPAAMRWTSTQLAAALLDCHQQARADVKAATEKITRTADPRLRGPLQELLGTAETTSEEPKRSMSEEEIQAADDAYFERINQGWANER
ncbi:hypothetical protein NBRGN_057_03140 [Nocardia brasiliensis NBRC 14402]|uniref:YbaB/EbfC family nucleoid-associated protein n=1 Tax=Nocardia brasiliensis TaxID=37326 RepID=UPI0002E9700C|nr:YbaB/EbfC family nucleoid-associated protein [Nocardia brasiliensis]ASF11698.1 hypothetical protein CEQ30_35055 [Nocardia brasiliensis]GAJ82807.1 hypothetical protein NBRGN_057_03140 [Nocardia brasiliensis NBRC 14402]SUB09496.1 Uncharacterised protein [Nocardia brasiliensis]